MIRTLFPCRRALMALPTTLAVILGASLINPVDAVAFDGGRDIPSFSDGQHRDFTHRDRDHRRNRDWRKGRHDDRQASHRERRRSGSHSSSYGGGAYGLPSILPGNGTYSGGISVLRVKGNGTYAAIDALSSSRPVRPPAPLARIVTGSRDAACSFEAGVCVIRP